MTTQRQPALLPDPGPEDQAEDPRLVAFRRWLTAVDRRDWRAGQVATRSLRALGISCCLTAARVPRGGAQ